MSDLKRVTEMAEVLTGCKSKIAELESQLKAMKAQERQLEEVDLPDLMSEVGLSEVRLADGTLVSVVQDIYTSITAANRLAAHHWLEQHGFGGLIKTQVVVGFSREERERALEVAAHLADENDAVETKEAVHPGTLKSFVKERLAAGDDVPFDLFSINTRNVAELKRK